MDNVTYLNKSHVSFNRLARFLYMLYKRYHVTDTKVILMRELNKYNEYETYFIVYWGYKNGKTEIQKLIHI